jgi:hypothetical protein
MNLVTRLHEISGTVNVLLSVWLFNNGSPLFGAAFGLLSCVNWVYFAYKEKAWVLLTLQVFLAIMHIFGIGDILNG